MKVDSFLGFSMVFWFGSLALLQAGEFKDEFQAEKLGPKWTTIGGNWKIVEGVLQQVSTEAGDPTKAIIHDETITVDHMITAKVRVDGWQEGGGARAGVGLFTDVNNGHGYSIIFYRDNKTITFLDDYVQLGPSYSFAWQVKTWYWFKMKSEKGALYAKVWKDGDQEPGEWPYQWERNDRIGFPSLNGGCSGQGSYATVSFSHVNIEWSDNGNKLSSVLVPQPVETEKFFPAELTRPAPISMDELTSRKTEGVSVAEVSDYIFGNYQGKLPSPPCADLNPKKAFVVFWKDFSFRFVFSHEGSYCPWFELPGGAGCCHQFFEGNSGWAELFNQYGRKERNSFVDVIESGPKRVWVRWTYFGVNQTSGQQAYRATEDFWAYPNGLILRRQTYRTLMPGKHEGYAREPIELIGMCPVGKLWSDVLEKNPASEERHALAVLDAFSPQRHDEYWTPKPGTLYDSTQRWTGCAWKEVDDAKGVALVLPLKEGAAFCIFGDASGYRHDYTRIKGHTFPDTGPEIWGSMCWDHWPIGWLNSQGHNPDANSLQLYPNHFSPMGMDFFALPNEVEEQGIYYSLIGIGGNDLEAIRAVARRWLDKGTAAIVQPDSIADLPSPAAHIAK